MEISFHRCSLRRLLLLAGGAVAGAGVLVEALRFGLHLPWAEDAASLLSLSEEANLPTWFAVCLALICALLLVLISAVDARERRYWGTLAAGFFYISFDELVQIHELARVWFDTSGVLYFDWIIPAALVVAVLAIYFAGFVLRLPPRRRRQFVLAGAVYVSGAVLMEMPLGYWAERAGFDNLVYALIDALEEILELLGLSMFLVALLEHAAGAPGRIALTLRAIDSDLPSSHRPDEAVVPEVHDRHHHGDGPQ